MPKEKKSPRPNQEAEIARLKAEYLVYYEKLPVQRLAAASVGRDENTIIDWRNKDDDFREARLRARANWALRKANSTRVREEFLLERIMKDEFAERKEVTGKDGDSLPAAVIYLPTNGRDPDSTTKAPAD